MVLGKPSDQQKQHQVLYLVKILTLCISNLRVAKGTDCLFTNQDRGGSRTAATSKMKCFVIIVNGWKQLTIITKRSILDAAVVLDTPLQKVYGSDNNMNAIRIKWQFTQL